MDLEALKYPVGKYQPAEVTDEVFEKYVNTIAELPKKLRKLVSNLSYDELELPYRPGGWNIKQVVHHLADSHMNSFIRFKLCLTEDNPTIRPYDESKWAETADATNEDVTDSLDLLEGLHTRWVVLMKSLSPTDRNRPLTHPEFKNTLTLGWMLGLYDWHCRHHLAHIEQAIEKDGEFVS